MSTSRPPGVGITIVLLAVLALAGGPCVCSDPERVQLPAPTGAVAALFATPTRTSTATPTCAPGRCTPTPTATATPTPTAAATRTPAHTARPAPGGGQILFLTDREGSDPWNWDSSGQVYVMNADGTGQRRAPNPALYDQLAAREACSNTGVQCVYVAWNKASSSYDLFIRNTADGWTFYATGGRFAEYSPVWSPVDNRIAYVTGEDGNDEIHVWNLDTRRDRRLTFEEHWDKHPTWSPDGQRIAFWSNRATGRKQVWVMDVGDTRQGADGRETRNLSDNAYNDWDPIWVK